MVHSGTLAVHRPCAVWYTVHMNKMFLNLLEGMQHTQARARCERIGCCCGWAYLPCGRFLTDKDNAVVLFLNSLDDVVWAETTRLKSKSAPREKTVFKARFHRAAGGRS